MTPLGGRIAVIPEIFYILVKDRVILTKLILFTDMV